MPASVNAVVLALAKLNLTSLPVTVYDGLPVNVAALPTLSASGSKYTMFAPAVISALCVISPLE